jgi:16S rRNA (adenine1518-N6/adenine1519-N6)-dimethyltransferase
MKYSNKYKSEYKKTEVTAKKHLGQHFLNDETIAENIVNALKTTQSYKKVLEVGPGMGVLTKYLIKNAAYETHIIDIDTESITYLEKHFPELTGRIISGDFLQLNLQEYFNEPYAIIGNFPYNISSQILFNVIDNKEYVPELVGMFQKEVAERIASKPKKKAYGILSVLLQAYYDIEYLFTVDEHVFIPPPAVKSAVIRCTRNNITDIGCDEKKFKMVVKLAFNQRRKTMRNSLSTILSPNTAETIPYLQQRAEELSWQEFAILTNAIYPKV